MRRKKQNIYLTKITERKHPKKKCFNFGIFKCLTLKSTYNQIINIENVSVYINNISSARADVV